MRFRQLPARREVLLSGHRSVGEDAAFHRPGLRARRQCQGRRHRLLRGFHAHDGRQDRVRLARRQSHAFRRRRVAQGRVRRVGDAGRKLRREHDCDRSDLRRGLLPRLPSGALARGGLPGGGQDLLRRDLLRLRRQVRRFERQRRPRRGRAGARGRRDPGHQRQRRRPLDSDGARRFLPYLRPDFERLLPRVRGYSIRFQADRASRQDARSPALRQGPRVHHRPLRRGHGRPGHRKPGDRQRDRRDQVRGLECQRRARPGRAWPGRRDDPVEDTRRANVDDGDGRLGQLPLHRPAARDLRSQRSRSHGLHADEAARRRHLRHARLRRQLSRQRLRQLPRHPDRHDLGREVRGP